MSNNKTEDKRPRSAGARSQVKNEKGRTKTKIAHGKAFPPAVHQDPPRDHSGEDGEYAIQVPDNPKEG